MAQWNEKRNWPRIAWNFIVKFKPRDTNGLSPLQVVTIQDLSEGGASFFSNTPYQIGQLLDVEIQFPSMKDPMKFTGEVRRCTQTGDIKTNPYYCIGVRFVQMDEVKKRSFIETVEFFLKKQSEGR